MQSICFPSNFATPSQTIIRSIRVNPCSKKILRVQISPCSSSNHLPSILHLPPQHRAEDHLYVLPERIIPIVIAVEPHLVGIDDRVVILHCYVLRVSGVACLLSLGDVFGDHLIFEAVFQGGGTGDAGSQLQHVAVVALRN